MGKYLPNRVKFRLEIFKRKRQLYTFNFTLFMGIKFTYFKVFWLKASLLGACLSHKIMMILLKLLAVFNANKWEIGVVGLLFAIAREVNIININNASFLLKGFKHDYQIIKVKNMLRCA
ncbi:hypothetical protein JN11_00006 [Mucilaginibacter frigoritolerans]|jgi:hypothetical protein|uniref:Uncharacterized protein n=1 Tax=Mucilaginibacter frigoritolerans TaxID=652788 RepID=A0A562UEV1_9SPHI|nr:hypothetical protein [Mucilaginibacter frigoritolerans]TWJ04298.1 hypothetical protein JN11_00006 [Mucilaginibacter frigoritolerans]